MSRAPEAPCQFLMHSTLTDFLIHAWSLCRVQWGEPCACSGTNVDGGGHSAIYSWGRQHRGMADFAKLTLKSFCIQYHALALSKGSVFGSMQSIA